MDYVDFVRAISIIGIYLTHHSFCGGPWSVYHLTDSPIVGLILIVSATAVVTVPLHFLGNKINGIIIKQK